MEEIEMIFDNKHIEFVDLSRNHLKKTGDNIGQKMKTEIRHIKGLDLTLNYLPNEANTSCFYGF